MEETVGKVGDAGLIACFSSCDRDSCPYEQAALFDDLPFRNKVFFTTRRDRPLSCAAKIPLKAPCVPRRAGFIEIVPRLF